MPPIEQALGFLLIVLLVAVYAYAKWVDRREKKGTETFRGVNSQDIIRTDPSSENSGYRYRGLPETSSLQPMLNPASSESLVRGIVRRDSQGLAINI